MNLPKLQNLVGSSDNNLHFVLPPPPIFNLINPPQLDSNSYNMYFQIRNMMLINGQEQYVSTTDEVQKKLKQKFSNCQQISQNTSQQVIGKTFNITLLTRCERCLNWIQTVQMKIHMTFHAAIILDNLFLGDKFSCQSRKQLIQRLRVTHVVNATTEILNYFEDQGIKYCKLDLLDNLSQDVIQPCIQAAEFINLAVTEKMQNKVFVHCAMGKSRSVSVIIIYLVVYQKMTVDGSLKLIREKRKMARPNVNYMKQLYQFQQKTKMH